MSGPMRESFDETRRIGLLGGSFDPPHRGHLHISQIALKRLQLDAVWWLMSPGNPLKPDPPADIARRIARARRIITSPRIEVSDFEARHGTRYTADTLGALASRFSRARFVWMMGTDNLAQFHHWQRWTDIMRQMPIAVFSRPGTRMAVLSSPMAIRYRRFRIDESDAAGLSLAAAPAWTLLTHPLAPHSSTALREAGQWVK